MDSVDSSSQPTANAASDVEPPAKASDVQSPSKDSDAESPAKASNVEPPAKTSDVESPAKASNVESTAKALNVESTAKASDNESPAKASDESPAKASDESPAKASDESPAKASDESPVKTSDNKPPAIASYVDPATKSFNNETNLVRVHAEPPAKSTNIEPSTANTETSDVVPCAPAAAGHDNPANEQPSRFASGMSLWAKTLKLTQQDSKAGSALTRFTSGLGLGSPSLGRQTNKTTDTTSTTTDGGSLESFTKGLVDSSRNAVKAMQVKARHIVSQNKIRYQEGEFDLDMTYITENIIAMGFPAGDLSSGIFGFFEGFYRNHMEEVIKFFETNHKGKYKVYNLCSERLYDASRFEGKVASFPFDDHNCPPIQLIPSFCQSAYSWLKEDIQNVVVVHCKAGMARTGLMICSLLLFLKFFPTAEEAIDYYNTKRCSDGKALVLPSQIRYVKYYDRILTYYNGEIPSGRRCMLRGFRIHNCPSWIRPSITISNHSGVLFSTMKHPKTKNLMPEDFWMKAPKKGVVVFALPGEPGLTELSGDFKVCFHERQGDFYCWLNTTMTENRKILSAYDLDDFEKRKFPSPGFQIEIVMIDYDGTPPRKSNSDSSSKVVESGSQNVQTRVVANSNQSRVSENEDNDDVFSDDEKEEKSARAQSASTTAQIATLTRKTDNVSLKSDESQSVSTTNKPTSGGVGKSYSGVGISHLDSMGASEIKAIAADASVFSFGDEEDYESE